jgi:hypothetical protein
MYVCRTKKSAAYRIAPQPPAVLQERPRRSAADEAAGNTGMVRAQIYLTRAEHEFVSAKALRRGKTWRP